MAAVCGGTNPFGASRAGLTVRVADLGSATVHACAPCSLDAVWPPLPASGAAPGARPGAAPQPTLVPSAVGRLAMLRHACPEYPTAARVRLGVCVRHPLQVQAQVRCTRSARFVGMKVSQSYACRRATWNRCSVVGSAPAVLWSPQHARGSPWVAATSLRGTVLHGRRRARGVLRRVQTRSTRRVRGACTWLLPERRLAQACSGLQQVLEATNDGLMKRTHRRPLPAGLISRRHALAFAAGTGLAGVAILYFKARPAAAFPR